MEIFTELAGANFRPAEAKELIRERLEEGAPLRFEPDFDNQYDPGKAIKVLAHDSFLDQWLFIGFVPGKDNGPLAAHIKAGGTLRGTVYGFAGTLKPIMHIEWDHPDEEDPSPEVGGAFTPDAA